MANDFVTSLVLIGGAWDGTTAEIPPDPHSIDIRCVHGMPWTHREGDPVGMSCGKEFYLGMSCRIGVGDIAGQEQSGS